MFSTVPIFRIFNEQIKWKKIAYKRCCINETYMTILFVQYVNVYRHVRLILFSNTSNTSAAFLDLDLSIDNGFISSKIYYKRDDLDFSIVNVPLLTEMFPVLHHTVYTYLKLFVSLGLALLLEILTLGILF